MGIPERKSIYLYFLLDFIALVYELLIYSVVLLPLMNIFIFWPIRNPVVLSSLILLYFFGGALIFGFLVVATKRIFLSKLSHGRLIISSNQALPWIFADRLMKVFDHSPYNAIITGTGFLRYLFYRGMGAKIKPSLMLGPGASLGDPWLISIKENVTIGAHSEVVGHKVQKNIVSLLPVEIGANVLIGTRVVIFPGVTIGDIAVVGAGSIVNSGTTIGPGETWQGIPAKKISLFFNEGE